MGFDVENVVEEVASWDEAALVRVGPRGSVFVELVGEDGREEFRIGVGAGEGAGVVRCAGEGVGVVSGVAFREEPEEGVVEIKGERSAGEPCAETSEENCLNGGVGVEPSSVGDAVWARGGGACETKDEAEVG